VATLLLAFAVPFVFFSLSDSKLPLYIMPVIAPLLALACAFEGEEEGWTVLKRAGWELLVLGAIFVLAGPALMKGNGTFGWVLGLGIAFVGLGLWGLRPRGLSGPCWMTALGAGLLLLSLVAHKAAGPGKSVEELVRQAPADAQWISGGNYFQGITFYTGARPVVIAGTGELAFGRNHLPVSEQQKWFPESLDTLQPTAERMRTEDPSHPVWALISKNAWRDLPEEKRQAWVVVDHSPSAWLVHLK